MSENCIPEFGVADTRSLGTNGSPIFSRYMNEYRDFLFEEQNDHSVSQNCFEHNVVVRTQRLGDLPRNSGKKLVSFFNFSNLSHQSVLRWQCLC